MKNVITHGSKYGKAIYSRKCSQCGCVFEFDRSDIDKVFYDHCDGYTYWYIECPECGDKTGFPEIKPIRVELVE